MLKNGHNDLVDRNTFIVPKTAPQLRKAVPDEDAAGTLTAPAAGHGCHFWCLVVTSVTFCTNLSNFENNPKISKNP